MGLGLVASVNPAAFTYSGGGLRSRRLVPARLRYSGGTVMSQRETTLASGLGALVLDRLTPADMIPGEDPAAFMRRAAIWQSNCEASEAANAAINARVDELAAIVARLAVVETVAQTANDNAVAAAQTVAVVQTAVSDTFGAIDPTYRDVFDENASR